MRIPSSDNRIVELLRWCIGNVGGNCRALTWPDKFSVMGVTKIGNLRAAILEHDNVGWLHVLECNADSVQLGKAHRRFVEHSHAKCKIEATA